MKTKDKILLASLDAFSEEGVGQISTNHIADILDISPGNLYYHFKSKSDIIVALYECFIIDYTSFVAGNGRKITSAQEVWLIINLTYQLISKYRFIFRDASYTNHRYPETSRSFNKLLQTTEKALQGFLNYLRKYNSLNISEHQTDVISTNINLLITQWFNYVDMHQASSKKVPSDEQFEDLANRGTEQVISLLIPYMSEEYLTSFEDVFSAIQKEK